MTYAVRAALLAAALTLAACGTTAYDSDDDRDAFRAAAVSWVGAPLDDMIAVWGKPSERIIEPSEERSGVARWRDTYSSGSATQNVVGHRCIVEVRYGMDGTILKVDTVSHNCDEPFDEVMDQLARSGP
jgi:hypothetical protein